MKAGRQTTLRTSATVSGVGVHSGAPATLNMLPAEANTGIVFVRLGQDGRQDREVRADVRAVTATEFATVIGDAEGPLCSTAEHVLAALTGLGVDNAIIEIDGPEVPIMDGSAAPFVAAIDQAGLVSLSAPRRFIKVLKPVRVAQGDSFGELRPYAHGFRLDVEIQFDHPTIGRQTFSRDLSAEVFRHDLARARTFGFMRDVAKLWNAGYALGASFENTLVVTEDRVLNPEGLRFSDEFVRHKALDAIGDLSLAGAPLIGAYRSVRGGHSLNHAVLSALMADRSAWMVVDMVEAPRRVVRGHADIVVGMAAAAYAPEIS
ncbi:MAG: UDP-3-O-acyl-N-acetylglucosamine deacetylase [Xanthobacteraceae bacterium]|jgi:UDP-3-O-[3-hydroxymyristoyl] N-acetylglucosamine deacetylase